MKKTAKARKPPKKRTRRKSVASRVAASLGARPGTPEPKAAVDRFNAPVPPVVRLITDALDGKLERVALGTWWAIANHTGDSIPVPGYERRQGYAARIDGARQLTELVGTEVKPEWVRVEWVPDAPAATREERSA
jgi:hypothetical protein